VDRALNERDGRDAREIGNSRIPVWVVPAEQELMIARDTLRCILNIPHE
jgi:acetate kinase